MIPPENSLVGVIFPTEGQFRGELQRHFYYQLRAPGSQRVVNDHRRPGQLLCQLGSDEVCAALMELMQHRPPPNRRSDSGRGGLSGKSTNEPAPERRVCAEFCEDRTPRRERG